MHSVTIDVGGTELYLETGRMAKQANGSVFARYGESAVLATAACSENPIEGLDFVPLQVEYNEKYYAAGKIPGGFLKREGRPKDKEILVCRLIDRPMRPLFSKKFGREIQVVPTVVSADLVNPPDVVAMVAASAAVHISDIPFDGPVGAVRICAVNGELVVNPTYDQIAKAELEIVVAGTKDGITMVEGGAKQVSEELMLEAIEKARVVGTALCEAQEKLRQLAGKEKLAVAPTTIEIPNPDAIRSFAYPKMEAACFVKGKQERRDALKAVIAETREQFAEVLAEEHAKLFAGMMDDLEQEVVRKSIIEKRQRTDGRGLEDIRPDRKSVV